MHHTFAAFYSHIRLALSLLYVCVCVISKSCASLVKFLSHCAHAHTKSHKYTNTHTNYSLWLWQRLSPKHLFCAILAIVCCVCAHFVIYANASYRFGPTATLHDATMPNLGQPPVATCLGTFLAIRRPRRLATWQRQRHHAIRLNDINNIY